LTAGIAHQLLAEQLARRLFPHAQKVVVTKMQEGGSTWVYRIDFDEVTFYLRVLPEENASFAPEVYVHSLLSAQNLHVPEIVYFEHTNNAFQRSVVVTTAIAGTPIPLDGSPEAMASVLRQAGRELALINQVAVDGFGWVQRSTPNMDELRAEHATFAGWMEAEMEQALAVFACQSLLSSGDLARLQRLTTQAISLFHADSPTLAHGDFDSTHIFQLDHQYTGIIDFGEIRGANRLYDLGHFAIENAHFLPALLEGYQTVASLPPDSETQILQTSLLIAVGRIGRRAARQASLLAVDRQLLGRALHGSLLPGE
jgi:aminoglycoside phosphotransferase (APT) family kinase protein